MKALLHKLLCCPLFRKRNACFPEGEPARTQIFIEDYRLPASIGVHEWEKRQRQSVSVTVYADLKAEHAGADDDIATTLSYSDIVQGIRSVADQGHYELVETLASRIAALCLEHRLVNKVQVRVSKPDIYDDIAHVGATITQYRHNC